MITSRTYGFGWTIGRKSCGRKQELTVGRQSKMSKWQRRDFRLIYCKQRAPPTGLKIPSAVVSAVG